ncbi:MAG: site-specific integrase [Anaerolineales bacterium]|jgi:integrase
MAKRRANHEGSIFKTKHGTWRAQITIQGKRLSKNFDTQRECQDWLRKTRDKIEAGLTYEYSQKIYGDFLNNWMLSTKSTLTHNTWSHYNQIVGDYIIPELGKIKLVDLKPEHIQALYEKKLREGKGPRLVQYIHAIIRKSLNHALKLGVINRNPALATNPPKRHQKEMSILMENQVQALIIAGQHQDHPYIRIYQLAISTGMRQGEILGLQWKDIDWERMTIHIRRQLRNVYGGGLEFAPPKSKAGIRKVKVGTQVMGIMEEQKLRVAKMAFKNTEKWQDQDLVFPGKTGKPLAHSYVTTLLQKLLSDAGLPKIRFHDLRHTAASLMLNSGVPVLVVSKRLGHAKPSITLDVYGHLISSMQEFAAEVMDQFITPNEIPTAPQLPLTIDSQDLDKK